MHLSVNSSRQLAPAPQMEPTGNAFRYRHQQRNDDATLLFGVETTTNLLSGTWTRVPDARVLTRREGVLDEMSQTLPTDQPQAYFRLRTSMQ